jgi:hypothetical protein
MDIETFYEADERRRRSDEIELGTDWYNAAGTRYEVSWVVDTGELYLMREPVAAAIEDGFGDFYKSSLPTDQVTVAVVGWIPDRAQLEAVLAGWEGEMEKPDGITWLAARLKAAGVPREAPAPSE